MIAFINSPFQAYVLRCYLTSNNIKKTIFVVIREYNKVKGLTDTKTIKRCLDDKNIKYIIVKDGISKLKILPIFGIFFLNKNIIVGDILNKFNTIFLNFSLKRMVTVLLEDGTSFHVDSKEINDELTRYSIDICYCISGIPIGKYEKLKIVLGDNSPITNIEFAKTPYQTPYKFIILGSPLIEHNTCSELDYRKDLEQIMRYIEPSKYNGNVVYFRHRRENERRLRQTFSTVLKRAWDIRRSIIGFDLDMLSLTAHHYLDNKILISFPSTVILILAQNNLLNNCEQLCLKRPLKITNPNQQERSDRIFDICVNVLTEKGVNYVVL